MRLLVDVGNSAVKWSIADGTDLAQAEFELHRGAVAGLRDRLRSAWRSRTPLAAGVGCSVAAAAVAAEVDAAAAMSGVSLQWVRSQPAFVGDFTLENGYRDPAQLGADRWHAMIGACHAMAQAERPASRASFVVATAGTATTVDCIEAEGSHLRFVGGCIAPGVRLMLESLAAGTAGLPHANGTGAAFPDNTDDAIVSGVLDAQCGLIERIVARCAERARRQPTLLLAGGHAELLAERLRSAGGAPVIEHNLVLRGLALRAPASADRSPLG